MSRNQRFAWQTIGMAILAVFLIAGGATALDDDPGAHREEGDDVLLEAGPFNETVYFLEFSGMAYNERFVRSTGKMRIMAPSAFDDNPYLIIIEGFPQQNTRNSFYWHTAGEAMEAIENEVVSTIKNSVVSPTDTHFFYISPVLLENQGVFETHREAERLKLAEKTARPTRVAARAGELRLRVFSNTVSGSVWIKGYDYLENAYVMYHASILGRRALHLESQQNIRE